MTEPARPSGVDPVQHSSGLPDAVEPGPTAGTSQWARPDDRVDEGPSAPPEISSVGHAPPPLSPSGPPPGQPPGGRWGPVHPSPGPGWGPAPPPRETVRPPKRVDPVPGTPFGVVHLDVPPVTSGLAVGSLVAGIASILVSLLVGCFGIAGAQGGWGAWAAGAFTVLGALAGAGGMVAGRLGLRQIRRPAPPSAVRFSGRGLALAGISCGAAGLVLSLGGLGLALLVQFA